MQHLVFCLDWERDEGLSLLTWISLIALESSLPGATLQLTPLALWDLPPDTSRPLPVKVRELFCVCTSFPRLCFHCSIPHDER